jgi:dihydropteroate synthase
MTAEYRIMGVINVTPDSFSDGGRYLDSELAIKHGLKLHADGAAILDVGGESTRPGADPVRGDEELRRVLPVIEGLLEALAGADPPVVISVDTSKAAVADASLAAGATLVNDVTALRGDPEMAAVLARRRAGCCLMHMLGEPRTMQRDPHYGDVLAEVKEFLAERLAFAVAAGIAPERIMVDPGIGFGKTMTHNLTLLARLDELVELGRPVVIGTSRKSFLGRLTGRSDTDDRLAGTIASCVLAYAAGARVFRVHDVGPVDDALKVAAATVSARWTQKTPTTTT